MIRWIQKWFMEKHDEYEQEEEEFVMTDLATLAAQNKVYTMYYK